MSISFCRIAILVPLFWMFAASGVAAKPHSSSFQDRYGRPVAVLSSPEKSVEIFRMTAVEHPQWTYMVVEVGDDGTHLRYGDEHTIGRVLENLHRQIKTSHRGSGGTRCPAAAGWRYESADVRAAYCVENLSVERIERAISLIETTPEVLTSE